LEEIEKHVEGNPDLPAATPATITADTPLDSSAKVGKKQPLGTGKNNDE